MAREDVSSRSKALGDATATAIFIACAACCVEIGRKLSPVAGLSPGGTSLGLTILLLVGLVPVCERLGGALFNPCNNALCFAMGQGSAREHALRTVAQAAGGAASALAVNAVLPSSWTSALSGNALGLRPGTGLLGGAACEFVLGALLAFVVLWSAQLRSGTLKLWIPLLATVLAVKAGEAATGPSLNPAFTFAWIVVHPLQTPLEHLIVFWLAPIAAALFGGFAFRGYQQFAAERRRKTRRRTAGRQAKKND